MGYDSPGGSLELLGTESYGGIYHNIYVKITMPEDGTADSISVYVYDSDDSSRELEVAIYSHDAAQDLPEDQLTVETGTVPSTNSSRWEIISLSENISLTSGTVYWISVRIAEAPGDEWDVWFDKESGREARNYHSSPTSFPDPHPDSADYTEPPISMYLTYTPGGGAESYTQTLTETRAVAESVSRGYEGVEAIAEARGIAEAFTKTAGFHQVLPEGRGLVATSVFDLTTTISEDRGLTENSARTAQFNRVLSEPRSLVDHLNFELATRLSESRGLTGNLKEQTTFYMWQSEHRNLFDFSTEKANFNHVLSESRSLTEGLTGQVYFILAVVETRSLKDTLIAVLSEAGEDYIQVLTEARSLTDTLTRQAVFTLLHAENRILHETITPRTGYHLTFPEARTLVEAVTTAIHERVVAKTLTTYPYGSTVTLDLHSLSVLLELFDDSLSLEVD